MQKPLRLLSVAMCALLLGGLAPAAAALNAYLTLQGQNQGAIRGEVTLVGREDTIEVFEYHHLVTVPTSGGQVAGSPVHEPLVFTMKLGRATPKLYRALDTLERVDGTLAFYRPGMQGQEIKYFSITLNNARVIAIEPIKANTLDPANTPYPDLQRVRIIYSELTVTYEPDGSSYNMQLQSPAN